MLRKGSTPDALAIDDTRKLLYIANADNNSIAVAHIENRAHSTVVGFIPTGWYPSALRSPTMTAHSISATARARKAIQTRKAQAARWLRSSTATRP